jgi:hypothetical protein
MLSSDMCNFKDEYATARNLVRVLKAWSSSGDASWRCLGCRFLLDFDGLCSFLFSFFSSFKRKFGAPQPPDNRQAERPVWFLR